MIKQEILNQINNTTDRMAIANILSESGNVVGENAVRQSIKRRARILTTSAYINAICKVTGKTQEEIIEKQTAEA